MVYRFNEWDTTTHTKFKGNFMKKRIFISNLPWNYHLIILCLTALLGIIEAAELSGIVMGPDGTPMQDAIVTLNWKDAEYGLVNESKTARTNNAGEYKFTDLEPSQFRNYYINAVVPSKSLATGNSSQESLHIIPGHNHFNLNLKKTTLIALKLIPPNKNRLIVGNVYIGRAKFFMWFSTPDIYISNLTPGIHSIRIRTLTYSETTVTIHLEDTTRVEQEILLTDSNTVYGKLQDSDGKPIANALYGIKNYGYTHTKENGEFVIPSRVVGTPEELIVLHKNFEDTALQIPGNAKTNTLIIQLRRSNTSIQGKIVNVHTDSISNCQVAIKSLNTDRKSATVCVKPDRTGFFKSRTLGENKMYQICISCYGLSGLCDTVPPDTDLGLITMKPHSKIKGSVFDNTTNEMVDSFLLIPEIGPSKTFHSGSFSIFSNYQGVNKFSIIAPGYHPLDTSISLKSDEPNNEFKISLTKALQLEVIVSDGLKKVPNAKINVYNGYSTSPLYFRRVIKTGTTDSTGKCTLNQLKSRLYDIMIAKEPYIAELFKIELTQNQRKTITLQKGENLSGVIYNLDGTLADSLRVALKADPRHEQKPLYNEPEPYSIQKGKFTFSGLPNGLYTLIVLLPWSRSQEWVPVCRFDEVATGSDLRFVIPKQRTLKLKPLYKNQIVNGLLRLRMGIQGVADIMGERGKSLSAVPGGNEFMEECQVQVSTGVTYWFEIISSSFSSMRSIITIPDGEGPIISEIEMYPMPQFSGKITGMENLNPKETYFGMLHYKLIGEVFGGWQLNYNNYSKISKQNTFILQPIPPGQFPCMITDENETKFNFFKYVLSEPGKVPTQIDIKKPGFMKINNRIHTMVLNGKDLVLTDRCIKELELMNLQWPNSSVSPIPEGNYSLRIPGTQIGYSIRIASSETTSVSFSLQNNIHTKIKLQGGRGTSCDVNLIHQNGIPLKRPIFDGNNSPFFCSFTGCDSSNYSLNALSATYHKPKIYVWNQSISPRLNQGTIQVALKQTVVNVQCTDQNKKPLSDVTVFIQPAKNRYLYKGNIDWPQFTQFTKTPFDVEWKTDKTGLLQIYGLTPGEYIVSVAHKLYAAEVKKLSLKVNDNSTVEFTMSEGYPLTLEALCGKHPLPFTNYFLIDTNGVLISRLQVSQYFFGDHQKTYSCLKGKYYIVAIAKNLACELKVIKIEDTKRYTETFTFFPSGWIDIQGDSLNPIDLELIDSRGDSLSIPFQNENYLYNINTGFCSSILIHNLHPGRYSIINKRTKTKAEAKVETSTISILKM